MGKNVEMILASACLAIVGGLGCGKQDPQSTNSQVPDRRPCVKIVIHCSDASPLEIETMLAIELEKMLVTLAGSETVTTNCRTGLCTAKLHFKSETNTDAFLDLVRRKMEDLRASRPEYLEGYDVSVFQEPSPIATVDVYGDLAIHELVHVAEKIRASVLEDLPNSVTAEISGKKEICVHLEPSRMAAYAITAKEILTSLHSSRDSMTSDTLSSLVIDKGIPLGDIATVSERYVGPIIRTDGKPCVEIKFCVSSQDQASGAAGRIRESVDRQQADLPDSIHCRTYSTSEETGTEPVRLRVTVDLPQWLSTNDEKQEIHDVIASPLGLELAKLEIVDSVRSAVMERRVIVELTFGSDVPLAQAVELIRDKDIKVDMPQLISGPHPLGYKTRYLPLAIERCPPTAVAEVDVFGSGDIETLTGAARQVSERLREIQGVGSVGMNGLVGLRRQALRPRLDMPRLADLGISPQEVIHEVKLCTKEGEVVRIDGGAGVVRISYGGDESSDSPDLSSRSMMTKDGQMIPLGALAEVDFTWEIAEIARVDGIRVGSMDVYGDGTCDAAEVTKRIRKTLDDEMDNAGDGIEARLLVR